MNTTRMMATAVLVVGSGLPLHVTAQTTTVSGTEGAAVATASSARRSTEGTSVRPFTVHFPQGSLDDLRRRIAARNGPKRRPSRISPRVCRSPRCRSSRGIGRRTTTGAQSRRN